MTEPFTVKDYYNKYRELLQTVVDKSENAFEKKLIYLAAGALGLSFTFISDIVDITKSTLLWMLITGWVLLIGCLCINLLSHMSAKKKANKTIDDIDEFILKNSDDDTDLVNKINKRNRFTDAINYTTIFMLITGICCIIIFASYNMCRSTIIETFK